MAQQVMLRPQSSWYDQRFVPLHQLIMDQIEDGTLILHCKVVSPFFEYDSGNLFVLRKGEVFYLYSYGEVNNYVTWYKLEKETSTGANDGYLIASSDNDMKQERWLPIIASLCKKTSAKELVELFQKAPVGGELQIRIK